MSLGPTKVSNPFPTLLTEQVLELRHLTTTINSLKGEEDLKPLPFLLSGFNFNETDRDGKREWSQVVL